MRANTLTHTHTHAHTHAHTHTHTNTHTHTLPPGSPSSSLFPKTNTHPGLDGLEKEVDFLEGLDAVNHLWLRQLLEQVLWARCEEKHVGSVIERLGLAILDNALHILFGNKAQVSAVYWCGVRQVHLVL